MTSTAQRRWRMLSQRTWHLTMWPQEQLIDSPRWNTLETANGGHVEPSKGAPSLKAEARNGDAVLVVRSESAGTVSREDRNEEKKRRWALATKQMEPTPPLVFDVATGRVGTRGSAVRRLAEQPQGWVGDQSPRLAARNSWKQCRDMGRGIHPTSLLGVCLTIDGNQSPEPNQAIDGGRWTDQTTGRRATGNGRPVLSVTRFLL